MNTEKTIETNSFSVIKEKIIKTNELLLLFKEKNDKLGKATQAFKSLKNKYESANNEINSLKMENERLHFTLQTIKPEHENQKKELIQVKSDYDSLNEKYQQNMIESQLTIGNLEKSLNSCICQNTPSSPTKNNTTIKIKELKKTCSDLKNQEKELITENKVLLSKNEELEFNNLQIKKDLNNLRFQNSSLQTEIASLKEKISIMESVALQHKCRDKDEVILQKYREEVDSLKTELLRLSEVIKKYEIQRNVSKSKIMKDAGIQTVQIFEGIVDIKQNLCYKTKDISIQVNLKEEDINADNILLLNNIFDEMIVPEKLTPLNLCSVKDKSLALNNKCELSTLGVEIEPNIDKNIPNIVITPPTPLIEKTDKLESELLKSIITSNSIPENTKLNTKSECLYHENKNESGEVRNYTEKLKVSPESVNDVPLIQDCKSAGTKEILGKRKISRIRKSLMPFNPQAFVKCKHKKMKPKSIRANAIVKNEDGKDVILEALRTLQKNNIPFIISNESLTNLENNKDYLSQILNAPSISNNIYQEKLNCWSSRCSKVESYMLLRKSEENEPELLGFFNDKSDISETTKNNYSHPQHVMEQLLISIKKLVQNQEMRSYEYSRRKRSRIKSHPPNFSSETEIELERLFSKSSDILDRNKRLLAAARERHLSSAGESMFESESDVMVDSGVVTVSSKIDTDNSSSCSIQSVDKIPWKKPYNNSVNKLNAVNTSNSASYGNVPTRKEFVNKCPDMLSPIASSKGSSEKSYNFFSRDNSPIFISYPELISPLHSPKNSPVKQYSGKQTNIPDFQVFKRSSTNLFPDNLVFLNSPVSEEEIPIEDRDQHGISSSEIYQPLLNTSADKLLEDFLLPNQKPINSSQESLPSHDDKLELTKSDDNMSFNLSVKSTDLNCSLSDLNVSQLIFNSTSPSQEQETFKEETAKSNASPPRYYTRSQKQNNKLESPDIYKEKMVKKSNLKEEIIQNPKDKDVTKFGTSMLLRSAGRKRKLDTMNIDTEDSEQLNHEEILTKRRGRPRKLQLDLEKKCSKKLLKDDCIEKCDRHSNDCCLGEDTNNSSVITSSPNLYERVSNLQTNIYKSEIIEDSLKQNIEEAIKIIAPKDESNHQSNVNEQKLTEVNLFGEVLSDFDDESTDRHQTSICNSEIIEDDLKQSIEEAIKIIAPKDESNHQNNVNGQKLTEVSLFGEVLSVFDDEGTDRHENNISVKSPIKRKLKRNILKRNKLSSHETCFQKNNNDNGVINGTTKIKTDGKIQIIQNIVISNAKVVNSIINHTSDEIKTVDHAPKVVEENKHKNMDSTENLYLKTALIPKLPTGNHSTGVSHTQNLSSLNELSSTKSDCIINMTENKKTKIKSNQETPIDILSQVLDSMAKSGPKQVSSRMYCGIPKIIETPVFEKNEPVITTTTKVPEEQQSRDNIPDCPQSPEVVEISDHQPKLIPTNKPVKLPPSKVKLLIDKLMIYSNEEKILDNVIGAFAFQNSDYIIEIVLEKLSLDYHEKPDNSTPPSPSMTSTQRIFLGFLSKLDQSTHPNILVEFLSAAEEKLFNKNTCNLSMLQPTTRFYTAVCKLRRDINRMRRFICEAFYFAADFAPTMLFIILTMWAEVIPMATDISDNITAKVIVQLCHLKGCNKPGYNLLPLKDLLHKYFGYPTERWNCDDIFQDILVEFIRSPSKRLFKLTLLVFLKNKPTNWVHHKIKDILIPLYQKIPDLNVNLKATILILLANICSGFDKYNDQDWAVILELDKWFESNDRDDLDSIIKQSVTYVRGILPKRPKKAQKKKKNVKKQNNTVESNKDTTVNTSSI